MKRVKHGGYAQWKCRRCSTLFLEGNKKQVINFTERNCNSEVALYDGEHWYYMMMYRPHYCPDAGIGVAVFQGLSPTKVIKKKLDILPNVDEKATTVSEG